LSAGDKGRSSKRRGRPSKKRASAESPRIESFLEMLIAERGAAANTVEAYRRDLANFEGFLRKRGFSKSETAKIVETVLHEEGRPPESLFDFVQGITAGAVKG